jgi:ribosomal protein S5
VVKATLNALAQLRTVQTIAQLRGRTIEQIIKGSHVSA